MSVTAPVVLAHRGWASRYPENTRASVEAALEAGVLSVEIDIQLSADRVPVVVHDASLERTAALPARVTELPASELTALSVHEPARFGTRFAGELLPSLADMVDLLGQWPRARAFVEVKRDSAELHGVDETVALVLDALDPIRERSVVISFVERAVMTARRLGALATGWVLNHYDDDARRLADAMAPDYVICDHRKLPPAPLTLWAGPWSWGSYEITDAAHALALCERGVEIIESMTAGELAGALAARQEPNPGCPPGNSA